MATRRTTTARSDGRGSRPQPSKAAAPVPEGGRAAAKKRSAATRGASRPAAHTVPPAKDSNERLDPGARAALALNDSERINYLKQPIWINYTAAKQAIDRMEELLVHPEVNRMPNLMLIGDTNNGKTELLRHFESKHPASDNEAGEAIDVPVLFISMPPTPDEARLYTSILDRLFAPFNYNDRVDAKAALAMKVLHTAGVKLLLLDDFHNMLAGSVPKQRAFLNVIRTISNELRRPIVAAGIEDAIRAIQTDPQLSNRFEPAVLPRWNLDNEFFRLLLTFERKLPLKKASNLPELAPTLIARSEGYLGELSKLLRRAAAKAITEGWESISAKALDSISWVPPSERRRGTRSA
jgi:hypothetical protein